MGKSFLLDHGEKKKNQHQNCSMLMLFHRSTISLSRLVME